MQHVSAGIADRQGVPTKRSYSSLSKVLLTGRRLIVVGALTGIAYLHHPYSGSCPKELGSPGSVNLAIRRMAPSATR